VLVNPTIFGWACVSLAAIGIILVYEGLVLNISFDEDDSYIDWGGANGGEPVLPEDDNTPDEDIDVVIEENIEDEEEVNEEENVEEVLPSDNFEDTVVTDE